LNSKVNQVSLKIIKAAILAGAFRFTSSRLLFLTCLHMGLLTTSYYGKQHSKNT